FAGLYLVPGRLDDAKSLLTGLAGRLRNGLLPADVPDAGAGPAGRGADVSLWFVNAVHQFAAYGGDEATVERLLLPAVARVIDAYRHGTDLGVAIDADGLIRCGLPDAAATWMDAAVGGRPVTPRAGRPVEVNALWYNALEAAADLCRRAGRPGDAEAYGSAAARTRAAFNRRFWNGDRRCCLDLVGDDVAGDDPSVRPNQLLAVSLPFPVLTPDRWPAVVAVVRDDLLTPAGVRTLGRQDPRYVGRYSGPIADRDRAVHNGSAFPWLLGPYVTALVRAAGPVGATAARDEARAVLAASINRLRGDGLGHLPELCDGDAPHAPGGAVASALSVAELLRCYAEDVLGRTPRRAIGSPPMAVPAVRVVPRTDLLYPA
ncbi:MAG: hypothetical protein JWO31_3607, partial [Phycisphaerales bacterium]|nr:hypothetical protein [Phycisphaerales bacterium]